MIRSATGMHQCEIAASEGRIGPDVGGRLRQAREQRGWSLGDVARLTKLSPGVLRAIERNDFSCLPAGMYRKAYLRTVAVEVGLDPRRIAADYDALCEQSDAR